MDLGLEGKVALVTGASRGIGRAWWSTTSAARGRAPGSSLFPGGGWDRRQKADPDGIAAFVKREIPSGRFGRPEEIADVVTFLCSPRAGWITGACLPVDGGQSRAF